MRTFTFTFGVRLAVRELTLSNRFVQCLAVLVLSRKSHEAKMLRVTRTFTNLARSTELSATVALVDSFAKKPFSGNPAAIVFAHGKTAWMQTLATELNIPVTAFVDKLEDGGPIRAIRWCDILCTDFAAVLAYVSTV
jgi:hypothetical protein